MAPTSCRWPSRFFRRMHVQPCALRSTPRQDGKSMHARRVCSPYVCKAKR
jgi:hypothetical protein